MGCVGTKTRSLCQILEKPGVPFRGRIFNLILLKNGQNVCLDEISNKLKMGHGRLKTCSLGQIIEELTLATKGL